MSCSNRKLRDGVVFEGRCYMQYQKVYLLRYMKVHSCGEMTALKWYESSGLAALFELHHTPHGDENEIVVTKLGENITQKDGK